MSLMATKNLQNFDNNIVTNHYVLDIEASKLDEVLIKNKLSSRDAYNLILMIGNTICNIDDRIQVLKNIRSGMTSDDLFVVSIGLNSFDNKKELSYVNDDIVYRLQTQTLRLLGVDIEMCDYETKYNDLYSEKNKSIILDKDYEIHYELYGVKQFIRLMSGKSIKVWKHSLLDIKKFIEELEYSSFKLKSIKIDSNYTTALCVCSIK